MKKKVFLVVPSLAIGGQEKVAVDTAISLKEEYDVQIIAFHRHEHEYEKPCDVRYFDVGVSDKSIGKIINQIIRAFKLARLRRKLKPDVVYSFGGTANLTNALSDILSPGKTVVAIHGYAGVSKSKLGKFVYNRADSVICIANEMKDKLLQLYPKLKKSVVIENGYSIEKIIEKSKEEIDFTKKQPFTFITMGRLEKVKGYERLIKAFAKVKKINPRVELCFVGKGSLEETLKTAVIDNSLSDSVQFLGYQKNPHAYLSKADAYVLSSHSEGFPNALIEALSCSLPIVSVDCRSGPREILSKEYTSERVKGVSSREYGILTEYCEDEDKLVDYLAEGMLEIAHNAQLRESYIEKSVSRALCFSNEVYKDKITHLFQELFK